MYWWNVLCAFEPSTLRHCDSQCNLSNAKMKFVLEKKWPKNNIRTLSTLPSFRSLSLAKRAPHKHGRLSSKKLVREYICIIGIQPSPHRTHMNGRGESSLSFRSTFAAVTATLCDTRTTNESSMGMAHVWTQTNDTRIASRATSKCMGSHIRSVCVFFRSLVHCSVHEPWTTATSSTVEWSCVSMRHRGKMFSSQMKEKKTWNDTLLMRIRAEPSFRTCAAPHTRNPIRKTRSNGFYFFFSSMVVVFSDVM